MLVETHHINILNVHCKIYWEQCQKINKPNSPDHLGALVFVYNATPHTIIGYKPYPLMFACKAKHMTIAG